MDGLWNKCLYHFAGKTLSNCVIDKKFFFTFSVEVMILLKGCKETVGAEFVKLIRAALFTPTFTVRGKYRFVSILKFIFYPFYLILSSHIPILFYLSLFWCYLFVFVFVFFSRGNNILSSELKWVHKICCCYNISEHEKNLNYTGLRQLGLISL